MKYFTFALFLYTLLCTLIVCQLRVPSRHYIPNVYGNFESQLNDYATNQRNEIPEDNVIKHIYFFEPKPQDEQTRVRIRFPPAKKKALVIFIKAPETQIVPEIILPRPSEERTLIYVLSKKLEPLASVTIPSRLVSPIRRKPEVYYISYRDLRHAQKLVAESLKGQGGGTAIPSHSDENSFINALVEPSNRLTGNDFDNPQKSVGTYVYNDLKIQETRLTGIMNCSILLILVLTLGLGRSDVSHLKSLSGSYLPTSNIGVVTHLGGGAGGHFGTSGIYNTVGATDGSLESGGLGNAYNEINYNNQGSYDGTSGNVLGGNIGLISSAAGGYGGVPNEIEVHFYGGSQQEQSRLRIHVAPTPSRNRVLFVKSPDSGSRIVPEIVVPNRASEERTVVYVLSKKSEPIGSINIPAEVTNNVVKSKPQVYYLKYKNAQDAERAVVETLNGRNVGSSVTPISDGATFIKYLATVKPGSISGVLGSLGGDGVSIGHGLSVGSTHGGHLGSSLKGVVGSSSGRYGAPGASGGP
ncbi:hypothetical protein FQA39_LY16409 [Lamprigera yunnana]|nr:hypothetical protein FQA39_LY16409 [Lamprigera yunnana]